MALRLVIAGCCGRMGSRIAALTLNDQNLSITGAFETAGHRSIGQDLGVLLGQQSVAKAMALAMIVVVALVMTLYAVLDRRASRWLVR